MQIYVPKDSILISSNSNAEIRYDSILDKAYFYTIQSVKAGESNTLEIKYKLPFKIDKTKLSSVYKLYIDKQPGSYRSSITKDLLVDPSFEILQTFSKDIIYADDLSINRYYSALIKN